MKQTKATTKATNHTRKLARRRGEGNSYTEQQRYEQQAEAVLNFLTLHECLNASTPDFVTDAVIDAIDAAGHLLGLPTPTYGDEESEAESREMLVNLFSRTRMLDLRDDKQKVLLATIELLHNPETPVELWNEVSQFVTTQSNECGEELYQSPAYLTHILNSVLPEDRMGATREEGAQ